MTMLKNNFFADICVATFDGVVIIGTEGNPGNVNVVIPQASANRCWGYISARLLYNEMFQD